MTARLEVERMIADWLGTDVNTRIAAVPVDAGDTAPPAIAAYVASGTGDDVATPSNLAIFDSTRHGVVPAAAPPTFPALYVMCLGPINMMGEATPAGQIRYAESPVRLVIWYMTQDTDVAKARRNGCYTMRAVARSLRQLSKTQLPKIRNGINVIAFLNPMTFHPVTSTIGQGRIAGALALNLDVRDQSPEY